MSIHIQDILIMYIPDKKNLTPEENFIYLTEFSNVIALYKK